MQPVGNTVYLALKQCTLMLGLWRAILTSKSVRIFELGFEI